MKSASLSQKAYSFLMFLAVSVLAGLLISGLAVPFAALLGGGGKMAVSALDDIPADLETPAQHQRSEVFMADGSLLATFYDENRVYVPLSEISENMQTAQIAIEDHRFFEHGAIDFQGFGRAALKTLTGDTQGASTLTQQYVKMVRIEMAVAANDEEALRKADEVTIERKIIEARYAMALEERLTKDEILERYLNIAYYGDGAYGVQAAAKHFFNVDAKDLTLGQSAMLAGLVQNPVALNPVRNTDKAMDRRDVVLNQMVKWGMTTEETAEETKAEQTFDPSKVQRTARGCVSSPYPFLCDYVKRTLVSDAMPSMGKDEQERTNYLNRGGLQIHTLIDPVAQASAEAAVAAQVSPTDPVLANTTLIQPSTGLITAMAQSRPVMGTDAAAGETFYNYNVSSDMGGAEGYQAGSTFKPFTLASALNQGMTPQKEYNAPATMQFRGQTFRDCTGTFKFNQDYEPQNQGRNPYGNISMMVAAQKSVNTYFVQLIRDTGICASIDMAKAAGVKLSDGKDLRTMQRYPSFVLGTADVTPLSMAEAYATFANRGIHCDPIILKSVETKDGTEVQVPSANCKQAIPEAVADGVNYILRSVALQGTGRPAALRDGRDEAGKTGTTNNAVAVWYAGYTPEMAGVAMITIDKVNPYFKNHSKSLTGIRVKGGRLDGSGGGDAGKIWKAAMKSALADKPKTKFTAPTKTILEGVKVNVPSVRGMSLSEAKATLEAAGFSTAKRYVFSERAREGAFLGIEPSKTAAKFSTIYLRISKGKEPEPEPVVTPSASAAPATTPSAQPTGR